MPFFELLNSTMKDNTFVVSMLLQSLNIELLVQTEKKEASYIGVISSQDIIRLDVIKCSLSVLNYDLATKVSKAESKLEKLAVSSLFDKKVSAVLQKETEEIRLLYKIWKLDTNVVPFFTILKF